MTYPFTAKMPQRPKRQKHADAKTSDNYGFLRSLVGNECADVNARPVWNDPKRRTKEVGVRIYALHSDTAGGNGYRWIMDGKRLREMTHTELQQPLEKWAAARVRDWRRGESARSDRPRYMSEMYAYVRRNGGTVVTELKSSLFAKAQWIVAQLVESARQANHAPWFKALANMWGVQSKCANAIAAGAQFALIFGKFVVGRTARLKAARELTANWAIKPTAVW